VEVQVHQEQVEVLVHPEVPEHQVVQVHPVVVEQVDQVVLQVIVYLLKQVLFGQQQMTFK
jgi:hypothetical protein